MRIGRTITILVGAPQARPPERSGATGPRERRRGGSAGAKPPGSRTSSIFMRRVGRFVVAAAGLFAATFLVGAVREPPLRFLVVTVDGLMARVAGQTRPGSEVSTNGARG